MKKLAFPLACALSVASVDAANILFVSFHGTDAATANASNAAWGFNTAGAPDKGFTDLLTSAGHNVTRVVTTGTPNMAQMNAADLVIISRSVPSGDYQTPAETAAWNGITAPMMILGGYIIRGDGGASTNNARLGLMAGDTIPDTTGAVTLTATDPNHPIYQGITLGTGNTLSYAVSVNTPTGIPQRGISVVTGATAGGGTTIGTVSVGSPAGPGLVIGEWQAGATMEDQLPSDTLGGHRMVFLAGSREHAADAAAVPPLTTSSEIAGVMNLTAEGQQLFLNAVDYMAVPEPSTYALIGLGGMALFFRRRNR